MSPAPHLDNLRCHAGNATEIVTLGRSGFLGSQRFGAAVWNGNIPSTFGRSPSRCGRG